MTARLVLLMIVLTSATSFAIPSAKELDTNENTEDKYTEVISMLKKYINEEENKEVQDNIDKIENHKDKFDYQYQYQYQYIENELSELNDERQAVDPCGPSSPLVLTTASGTIQSPGYSSNSYPASAKCSWKIVAPTGKVVKITFNGINIERSNDCSYDSVQIWDVQNAKGVLIGKVCGQTQPMELYKSTGTFMYVYFVTDNVDSTGRFSVSWTTVTPQSPVNSPQCGSPAVKPDLSSKSLKIVNGVQAKPHSWPWQISLRLLVGQKQYHICGGTIISPSVVACAAHCLFDERHKPVPASSFQIVAGDQDQKTSSDGPTQTVTIKQLISHKNYDPTSASSAFDIAVFILQTPLKLNNNISAACLPTEDVAMNSLCYATGWGDTKDTGDETVLNQVQLPIVSQTQCTQNDYYGNMIVSSMLCAGYAAGGKDACQGDSGGPFVCYNDLTKLWYLQGITSWGAECAQPKKPGVYTRVTQYLDWIKANSGVTP